MERLTAPWLTTALGRRREAMNARFRMARLKAPTLDGELLLASMHAVLAPLEAGEPLAAEAAAPLVEAVFEAMLKLSSHGDSGRAATEALRVVLPAAAKALGENARGVVANVANAALRLHAVADGDAANRWARGLAELGRDTSGETFDLLGAVLAWREGVAPLRRAALAAATRLPATLALRALGAPTGATAELPRLLAAFNASPWFQPGPPSPLPRVAHRKGGFSGLGGAFRRPPAVELAGDAFLAYDQTRAFHLHADAFGATLTPAGPAPRDPSEAPTLFERTSGLGAAQKLPELQNALSGAANGTTAVVATADSLHLQVVALA